MTAVVDQSALHLAERVAHMAHVWSVCLIGSSARGDGEAGSDIDLLAVVDGKDHVKEVRRRIVRAVDGRRVQTKVLDEQRLADILDRRSTFAVHVLREAVVVRDEGERFARLRAQHSLDAPVRADSAGLRRRLELYDDLGWCQGLYLYCLADCYSVGRAAAYAILGRNGTFEFSARKAFARVAQECPALGPAAERIVRLRPFFRMADRDIHEPLPFPYRDCRSEAEAAVAAAHELIDGLQSDAAGR
jgi:predicted nucleotidyltransferase